MGFCADKQNLCSRDVFLLLRVSQRQPEHPASCDMVSYSFLADLEIMHCTSCASSTCNCSRAATQGLTPVHAQDDWRAGVLQ